MFKVILVHSLLEQLEYRSVQGKCQSNQLGKHNLCQRIYKTRFARTTQIPPTTPFEYGWKITTELLHYIIIFCSP